MAIIFVELLFGIYEEVSSRFFGWLFVKVDKLNIFNFDSE